MLSISSRRGRTLCDGVSRREFLRIGALGVGGLTLADLLRLQARGEADRHKAVIMIYLEGGPSHLDIYDLKPDAPAEYRGDYRPIHTRVSGFDICEKLPLQAKIADQLALVRNMAFNQPDHRPPEELMTGFYQGKRPAIGSVVSRLERDRGVLRALPPYVALDGVAFPAYLGNAHRPFTLGKNLSSLALNRNLSAEVLEDRHQLLKAIDTISRDLDDAQGNMAGMDAFNAQAMEMLSSPKARAAFDVSKEPQSIRDLYGPHTEILQARRLIEAGVKVVTLTFIGVEQGRRAACGFGGGTWDTHGNTYKCLNHLLPQLDQAIYALVTDLRERGMLDDVGVVAWGEFGRAPRLTPNPGRTPGRNHWPQAGFALLAGGGLRTGQVVGATDSRGGRPTGEPYRPTNVLATLYHVLGIDPATTIPDHTGRPMYLLDDRRPISELV